MSLYRDLGASHIKVLYKDTVQVFEYLTKEKVNVKDFSNFVKNILSSYTFSKRYVCSQMHGFHIEGTPYYISWMCEDVEPQSSDDLTDTSLLAYHGPPYFNSIVYAGGRLGPLVDTILEEV